MPISDVCQPEVETALTKEGWTILNTPVYIAKGDFYIYVDLEAQQETKQTFIEGAHNEFYVAIGQYISYRTVLRTQRPQHQLYLAVPADVNPGFTNVQRDILTENHVKLILVDLKREVISQWIE